MTTDYVKKAKPRSNARKTNTGKANSRTNNTRPSKGHNRSRAANNKQNAATAQKPPYMAIALLVITVAAFGYFLWSIKGSADMPNQQNSNLQPPQKVASKPLPKPTVIAQEKQQQPDIPAPPEEQWQYIDELKTKEVKVEKAELKKTGPWLLQCATFKEARRAESLKAQLALLGFESRIKPSDTRYGLRHRVQLGPYETNRDAQAERHKLSRHKINGCKIWPWK